MTTGGDCLDWEIFVLAGCSACRRREPGPTLKLMAQLGRAGESDRRQRLLIWPPEFLEREWRNWQTRMVEGHMPVRAWRFESSLAHSSGRAITGRVIKVSRAGPAIDPTGELTDK